MVAEEIELSLTGGAPWGFRLQGGAEQHKPLQVAKVRKRSKACRAGLKEQDELVSIDDHTCAELSHAQAMMLIDSESATLKLRVKRIPSEFHSSSYAGSSASPQSSLRVVSPPVIPFNSISSFLTPIEIPRGVTSPPDSEAYYGETDSDADTRSNTHQRRQRRTPPHIRSPVRSPRYDNNEEETSEMSGYESAPETGALMQEQWNSLCFPGVPRRNIIYLPPKKEWSTPTQAPNTPTPHTLTPTPDQGIVDGEGEGDSGFQEVGGCIPLTCPPLLSPERAKDTLKLGSGNHLVPMVGPQQSPVSEELSTTYMDKARQAKLQRGESAAEKQVKEARTKCRSIASLLTDAPNPNSKGVLMFKKRRQRAKKYTLTCFGKAEGGRERKTEGDTGGETEEEGGSSALSGSEVDEEGFSAAFDPTWDSGYFELLEKKSSACPSTTPTTPSVFNDSTEADILDHQTPQLLSSVNQSLEGSKSSANHSFRLESTVTKEPISNHPAHMSPLALAPTNVESVSVSRASVVLSPPSQTAVSSQHGLQSPSLSPPAAGFTPSSNTDSHGNTGRGSNASVLNRTARPFSHGSTPSRASVTSVMFHPPQPKPTPITMATKPVAAVSMVTISPTQHPQRADARRAMSSTSLYIPPRNNTTNTPPSVNSSCSALSPPSSQSSLSQPTVEKRVPPSPSVVPGSPACPSNALPFSPPGPTYHPSSTCVSTPPILTPTPPSGVIQGSFPVLLTTQPPPSPSSTPYISTVVSPQVPASDSISMREQRISVPAARSGILQEARSRSSKKPMFTALQSKDVSPNPDLMSMVHNMDGGSGRTVAAGAVPSGEPGHESGPEEDWLRLGAEACNFMQAQQGHKPPPVAPKPQAPEVPQLAGKGGQLFARRQSRMDRYVVERCPSAAPAPFSPAQTREPSPTPSLPATWKYSSNIRAPPPINYNPLLSPSCPLKAQKKPEVAKSGMTKSKGKKTGIKPVDLMNHQPYQLNSSLFSYGGGVSQDTSNHQQHRGPTGGPQKTARVYEVKRFSTPPPMATSPTLKVVVPRSATTLGEPFRRSEVTSPPFTPGATPYQHHQSPAPVAHPQWVPSPVSPSRPPAPTAPLPKLPSFSSGPVANTTPLPTFSHKSSATPQANKQFKSAPNLSPLCPGGASQQVLSRTQPTRVPKPRFSTSNLGLQPCVWRPGSTAH